MRFSNFLNGSLVFLLAASCGSLKKDEDNKGGGGIRNEKDRGCIQGVVRNGVTGERVALSKGKDKKGGVHVLVRNKLLAATPIVANPKDEKRKELHGEYYLCGFPLDETFPLFVWQEGYQNFEARVRVSSTLKQKTPQAQVADIERKFPTLLADINLYPVGVETKDLKFAVYFQGQPLEGATVQLKPTAEHVLDEYSENAGVAEANEGDVYSLPPQIRSVPLTGESDKHGEVVFKSKELVLGGVYKYLVIPAGNGQAIEQAGTIAVGLRGKGTNLVNQPYEVFVKLDRTVEVPRLVASTLDSSSYDAEGRLVLYFNQEVELSPGSSDTATATLEGARYAKLAAGRGAVNLKFEGKTLTLTPNWLASPVELEERNLAVVYQNIRVRPVGDSRREVQLIIPAEALRVYIFDRL